MLTPSICALDAHEQDYCSKGVIVDINHSHCVAHNVSELIFPDFFFNCSDFYQAFEFFFIFISKKWCLILLQFCVLMTLHEGVFLGLFR